MESEGFRVPHHVKNTAHLIQFKFRAHVNKYEIRVFLQFCNISTLIVGLQ